MAGLRFWLRDAVAGERPPPASCAHCRHRADARATLEQQVPGLSSFGSAYGESVADSRLCGLHDRFVAPADVCTAFSANLLPA